MSKPMICSYANSLVDQATEIKELVDDNYEDLKENTLIVGKLKQLDDLSYLLQERVGQAVREL